MSHRIWRAVLLVSIACVSAGISLAGPIAIVTGEFYTSNLRDDLVAAGKSVVEIDSYTAASLMGYSAVIQYGNDYADTGALTAYVMGGGTLIETPWLWTNTVLTSDLNVFSSEGGDDFHVTYPGITVLAAGDPLLNAVTFPAGSGGFSIGRRSGDTFVDGVHPIAEWADGAAFVGSKKLGSGQIIGINLHVITSDCAYGVIDQPWATQLFLNAASAADNAAVPEPGSIALVACGLGVLALFRRVAAGIR